MHLRAPKVDCYSKRFENRRETPHDQVNHASFSFWVRNQSCACRIAQVIRKWQSSRASAPIDVTKHKEDISVLRLPRNPSCRTLAEEWCRNSPHAMALQRRRIGFSAQKIRPYRVQMRMKAFLFDLDEESSENVCTTTTKVARWGLVARMHRRCSKPKIRRISSLNYLSRTFTFVLCALIQRKSKL